MNTCLNSLPMEQGPWTRRPGTRHVHTTRSGLAGRVVAFDFKQAAPYTMEFTAGFLRFRAGPTLVMTNDQQSIVSISTANPAKVKTATAHNWTSGNQVAFKDLGARNALLQNRLFIATVTSATEFTLTDALTGATIDGATLGTFVSGHVTRVMELTTPYADTLWSSLRAIQADIPVTNSTTPGAVLLQAAVKPYVLKVATPPDGATFATFTLAAIDFKDGPYLDPVPGGALVTPSALNGNINLTLSFAAYDAARSYALGDYVTSGGANYKSLVDANLASAPPSANWVAVNSTDVIGPHGFTGSDIGRMVRLFSEPPVWAVGTAYVTGNVVAYGGSGPRYDGAVTYWKAVANSTGSAPGIDLTKWALFPSGSIWTWGKILSLLNEIDRALAGSVNFGDLSAGGGVNSAFDGNTSKNYGVSAEKVGSPDFPLPGYIGKNYSGAAAQTIASGTIFPTIDGGFVVLPMPFTINMRAKATAPVDGADGTLLGTSGSISDTLLPVSIVSNDTTTAWNYVWFEIIAEAYSGGGSFHPGSNALAVAQVKFFNPPGTGTGNGVVLQVLGDALLQTTAIRTWRLGLFSDNTGWPTCGTYHEGRLWLSGVIGNRIDASKSNDPFNFAPTNPDGSVSGNNAISYVFNAPDVNPIFWMVPEHSGIVCGTQGGEWLVQATAQNLALTPTTIQAHRYTKYNCANIEPRRTDLTLAVVQAYKRELLEYFADVYSGRFSAHDIAESAKHLVGSGIQEIAYQQETIPVIWARTGDGGLIGCTYRRQSLISSQPPDFAGWHPHTLGSGRTVESICTGSNEDGTLDALVMVTNDTATGIRHVEMLTNFFTETTSTADAWFCDDGVKPSSTSSSLAPVQDAPYGGITLNGLWHLNGQRVQVTAAELDCGERERGKVQNDFLVTNGSVYVPFGDGISAGPGWGLFTADFANLCVLGDQIVVGLTYNSDGQIVRPNAPAESGARNGPAFGKLRRNAQCMLLVDKTAGLSIGTQFSVLNPVKFNQPGAGTAMAVGSTYSGVFRAELSDDNTYDGMVCWRVSRPVPATVMAIGAAIHTSDI